MSLTPHARVRRVRIRAAASVIVLAAWTVALGGLVSRDVIRSDSERLADLALRVNPGNVFFAVEQDGRHIGWASSTIDTLFDTLLVSDALVADIGAGNTRHRTTARSQVVLSRGFALRSFTAEVGLASAPTRISGHVEGDTGIAYVIETKGAPGDTQHVRVAGPVLVPTLVPLAAILGGKPKVGRHFTYHTFDPATMTARDVALDIQAESLFVLDDSAKIDTRTGRWVVALRDTVRAWRIGSNDTQAFSGWVDAQGRVVETTELAGLRLKRTAYELAFENWRLVNADSARDSAARNDRDIVGASAIASHLRLPDKPLDYLKVRLTAPSLNGLDLRSGWQSVQGDVVTIRRGRMSRAINPDYTLPPGPQHRTRFAAELRAEPGLQVHVPFITAQAVRIAGRELTDPRAVVEKTVRWVHDSLQKAPTISIPDAVEVLQTRRGDCNEHTQLFTALTRTMGIPTRIATGLVYLNGKFYYHVWPEVFLGTWVAVDPTFGQFPADASHIRLMMGGLARQAEILKLVGTLHIEVLEAR